MIITRAILDNFDACTSAKENFSTLFPSGLDISGLWGNREEADSTWKQLLCNEFLKHYIGWAIINGLLPATIRANLSGANLSGADLSGADLYRANLFRANLSGANLSGANLYGANLYGANLYEANLYRANLSGANLSWANLSGANLSGADLYEANLYRAIWDKYTILPHGFEPNQDKGGE